MALEDGKEEEGAATQGSLLLGFPHPLIRVWDLGHLGCPERRAILLWKELRVSPSSLLLLTLFPAS